MKKIIFILIAGVLFAQTSFYAVLQKRYENSLLTLKRLQFAKKAAVVIVDTKGKVLLKAGDKDVFKKYFVFNNKTVNLDGFIKERFLDSKRQKKIVNAKRQTETYEVNLHGTECAKLYVQKSANGLIFYMLVFDKKMFERNFAGIKVYGVKKGRVSYAQVKGSGFDSKINRYLKEIPLKESYAVNYRILFLNHNYLSIVYRVIVRHKITKKGYYRPSTIYFITKNISLYNSASPTKLVEILKHPGDIEKIKKRYPYSNPGIFAFDENGLYLFLHPVKFDGFDAAYDYLKAHIPLKL